MSTTSRQGLSQGGSTSSLGFLEVEIPFKLIPLVQQVSDSTDKTSSHESKGRTSIRKQLLPNSTIQAEKEFKKQNKSEHLEDDPLVFHEIKPLGMHTDRLDRERSQSSQQALDPAKLLDGFSTLKNQIEDLKSHLLHIKSDNLQTSKHTIHKPINKKVSSLMKENSEIMPCTTSKKKNKGSMKAISKKNSQGYSVPRSVSSKRMNSQKRTLRASLFNRSKLDGSIEANLRHNSNDRIPISVDKDRSDKVYFPKNGKMLSGARLFKQGVKKQTQMFSSTGTAGRGLSESKGAFLDQLLDAFPKVTPPQPKKKTVDVISLINISNLYSAIRHPSEAKAEVAKKKPRNNFSTPNKSQEKGTVQNILLCPQQPRGSCDEFRVSYTTIRMRSKHSTRDAHDQTKDTTRHEISQIKVKREESKIGRKTDRPANPLILSLKKWERPNTKIDGKAAGSTVGCPYPETETANLRHSAKSDINQKIEATSVKHNIKFFHNSSKNSDSTATKQDNVFFFSNPHKKQAAKPAKNSCLTPNNTTGKNLQKAQSSNVCAAKYKFFMEFDKKKDRK
jgi:hypothetical protein